MTKFSSYICFPFPTFAAVLLSTPIPSCAPLPALGVCVTSKWGECHGLLHFISIDWAGLTFWQVEVHVLFNILAWRFFHCGFWKDTLHTRIFLKLLSSLPFFGIRKHITKWKPFPCHHCPAHLFKPSCIYLCLISSPHFPSSRDGNADQMGSPIWVELCRASPTLEISSSRSKVLWATRKKNNPSTKCRQDRKVQCVCRRNIFLGWGNTEFSQHWSR